VPPSPQQARSTEPADDFGQRQTSRRLLVVSSQLTASHTVSPRAVALAWLLSRPAIVGAETVDELTANASAVDIDLDPPSSTPSPLSQPDASPSPHPPDRGPASRRDGPASRPAMPGDREVRGGGARACLGQHYARGQAGA
jgi:hypothetical protein